MDKKKGLFNSILAAVIVGFLVLILSYRFDFYYDLNDDVLMKDILSGAYSGAPESMNIQMLYPISALMAVLYKINADIPWYGYLLCSLQAISIYIVIYRSLIIIDKRTVADELSDRRLINEWSLKILTGVSECALVSALMLSHLINVQYTITVAFMAAAAAMWFLSADNDSTLREFVVNSIPAIVLIAVGFLLRSEMMLLMLPYVLASIVYSYSFELNLDKGNRVSFSQLFKKDLLYKYIAVIGIAGILMLVGAFSNKVVYANDGWREFKDLFDARTRLYDYEIIPDYEGNEEFFQSVSLNEAEAELFKNYNYGIDEKIDNHLMWQVADYAHSVKAEQLSFADKLKQKLRLYIYEVSHGKNSNGSDYPYNMVAGILYLMIIAFLIGSRHYGDLWRVITLFLGRSLIWVYILMGDRTPDRITHSLYLIETVVVTGLLLRTLISFNKRTVSFMLQGILISVIMLLQTIEVLPDEVYELSVDQVRRMETNTPFIELYEYMAEHPDNFYLMDVYSSVSYSEEMFGEAKDIDKSNSELLGGWFCGSVTQKGKVISRGYASIEKALISPGVLFVRDKDINMEWLPDYYESIGHAVEISLVDTVAGEFEIYEVLG